MAERDVSLHHRDVMSSTAAVERRTFISFASEDAALARRTVEQLERAGLRCWIADRDIPPAASYPAAITAAVQASGAVLLLLTEAANSSPHVLREIELAFNARRPVLPVRVAGALPSADLQYFLSTSQWFDAGAAFDDHEIAGLEERLRSLLERRQAAETRRRRWTSAVAVGIVALLIVAVALWGRWGDGAVNPAGASRAATSVGDSTTAAVPDAAAPPPVSVPVPSPAASTPRSQVNPRDGQTYVWVPPGQFVMGCSTGDPDCGSDEMPAHTVSVDGFWLGRTEVTAGQFRRRRGEALPADGPVERLPAAGVSWTAARDYCAGVGGRLPTEAEWEYAARGGTSTRYYGAPDAIAWYSANTDAPQPVATKTANAFGLHDMLGNVSEWVRDRYYNRYDDNAGADLEEPLAANAFATARGGSFVSDAPGLRASRRLEMFPDAEEPHIGFRCAIDRL